MLVQEENEEITVLENCNFYYNLLSYFSCQTLRLKYYIGWFNVVIIVIVKRK